MEDGRCDLQVRADGVTDRRHPVHGNGRLPVAGVELRRLVDLVMVPPAHGGREVVRSLYLRAYICPSNARRHAPAVGLDHLLQVVGDRDDEDLGDISVG
jgi:hypothetical protein